MPSSCHELLALKLFRFDLDAFYQEAARILRPQGTLAVWGYDIPCFEDSTANDALMGWYMGTLKEYWSPRRALVANHYAGVLMMMWRNA